MSNPLVSGAVAFVILVPIFILLEVLNVYPLRRRGFRPSVKPPKLQGDHTFRPSGSQKFTGGVRVGRLNASIPFASIMLDERYAHVSGLLPVWIEREVVTKVHTISVLLGRGVRFDSADGRYDGVIFWSMNTPALLAAFERFAWPVDPS